MRSTPSAIVVQTSKPRCCHIFISQGLAVWRKFRGLVSLALGDGKPLISTRHASWWKSGHVFWTQSSGHVFLNAIQFEVYMFEFFVACILFGGIWGSLPIFQFLRSKKGFCTSTDPFYVTYPQPIPTITPPWQYSQWLHRHCGIFPNPSLLFFWPALHDAHSHEATLPADFLVQWVS